MISPNVKVNAILWLLGFYTAVLISGANRAVTWDWYVLPSLLFATALIIIARMKNEGDK